MKLFENIMSRSLMSDDGMYRMTRKTQALHQKDIQFIV